MEATLPTETWKPVPGLENVEASNLGRIRAILQPNYFTSGYQYVYLKHKGRSEQFMVQRLVAAAWHGLDLFNRWMFAMHIDDVRDHNAAENLRVGTLADNSRDCVEKGRQCKGEAVHFAKLTEKEVRMIRSLSQSFKNIELAKLFNTSESNIARILAGEIWKHVKD